MVRGMHFLMVLGFCGARRPLQKDATDVNSVGGGELAARKFGGLVGEYIYAYVMRISRCLFAALFLRRIWRARRYALCKVPTRSSSGKW